MTLGIVALILLIIARALRRACQPPSRIIVHHVHHFPTGPGERLVEAPRLIIDDNVIPFQKRRA
jgi:hypothetical protein